MFGDFLTYVVSDATKATYCPRQVYGKSLEFQEAPFFTSYCATVPCCGDIDCNRKACWKMLESGAPYVQDKAVEKMQNPTSMIEFAKRLDDYARDCGIKVR